MFENFKDKFDLIIFDCDGTLVDTEYLNNLALQEVLTEEDLPAYGADYAERHFTGQRMGAILEKITAETGKIFPDTMGERYAARARELTLTLFKTIDGAQELVKTAAQHVKICVGSNGQRENVLDSLERGELLPYFPPSHVFTGVQVPHAKPAPDLFLFAAKNMGVEPARCLVIEDSIPGVTAGASAKMTTLGFTGSHKDKTYYTKALQQAGASYIYDSHTDIRKLFFGK
ncbi:MAG: HAD family hydrolase [Alphaproteobacteria bacterium]